MRLTPLSRLLMNPGRNFVNRIQNTIERKSGHENERVTKQMGKLMT